MRFAKQEALAICVLVIGFSPGPALAHARASSPAAAMMLSDAVSYWLSPLAGIEPGASDLVAPPDRPASAFGQPVPLPPATTQALDQASKASPIPDTAVSYRPSRFGPKVEVGALGGGLDSAPGLAHLAVDWIF